MLKTFCRIALASVLGVSTFGLLIESSDAQAPRPKRAKIFEQGEGRHLPYRVSRDNNQNDEHPYYHRGWWYNVPWWQDNYAYGGAVPYGESTAGFRVYGDSNVGHPYHTSRNRYYRNGSWYDSPAGVVTAPLTIPFAVATAPFRAFSGQPVFGNRRHADWCSTRYRSYNPSENTWVSNRGVVRQCVSPYS